MKKRLSISLLLMVLLLIILTGSALAADAGASLKQAVQAAWQKSAQSTGTEPGDGTDIPDASQANAVALNLAEVVIDMDFARNKHQFLEARQKKLTLEIEQADIDFKMGKIKAKDRDGLKQEALQNDFDLNFYKMQVDNGKKGFQRLTGTSISEDFNYDDSYLIVDAGKLSLPPSVSPEDTAALEKQLNNVIIAYSKLGGVITAYIDAAEKLAETEKAFKTGKVGNKEFEAGKVEKEKARLDALEGKAAYSKLLYQLDCSLQGYISRDVKKISDPIFQQYTR